MSQTRSLVLLAGAALSLGGANAALAQTASNDEVRAVVAEMMKDAETRTNLLSAGDGGHDNGGFFLAGDGFKLNVGGMLQFRYYLNFRDKATGNDFEPGFQATRTKVNFAGTVHKDWNFRVEGDFDREDGAFFLEDAWAGYTFSNGAKARWGQFKLPLLREELVSDSHQLAAERSITNDTFSQGWSQGIELSTSKEAWRAAGAFSDGLKSQNTDFTTRDNVNGGAAFPGPFTVSGEGDYAFTGRFEYMFSGNWGMFDDFTANKGQDFGFLLGVAGHYQQSDNTASTLDLDRRVFEGTVDLSFEGDSWNLYGAVIGRYSDVRNSVAAGSDSQDFTDWGIVVQGGYRFAENTELFARYDGIIADGDHNFSDDNFNFLTVGLNQYYAGHAAKATVDFVYCFNNTSDLGGAIGGVPNTGQGILGNTDDGEVVVRFQFQLLF